jgi:hypothetical protein
VAAGLLAVGLAAGCAPTYGQAPVSLRMKGGPPDATVVVDDQPIAPLVVVQKRGLSLRPGRHRITVERDGYFPWDMAIDADEAPISLDVQLVKIPR